VLYNQKNNRRDIIRYIDRANEIISYTQQKLLMVI